MPLLIVRDTQGQELFSRDVGEEDYAHYYRAYVDAEAIEFNDHRYRVHSVARTRPLRALILCVSALDTVAITRSDDEMSHL